MVDDLVGFVEFSFSFHSSLYAGGILSSSSQAMFGPITLPMWIGLLKAAQLIVMIKTYLNFVAEVRFFTRDGSNSWILLVSLSDMAIMRELSQLSGFLRDPSNYSHQNQ